MRISDWSSDVCSSDLRLCPHLPAAPCGAANIDDGRAGLRHRLRPRLREPVAFHRAVPRTLRDDAARLRSAEHTSELQSLMRIPHAGFCLKKNIQPITY